MMIKRAFYLALGFFGLVLGSIGTVVPMLPTVPFFLLAAIGFGKSSERLECWFKNTKLYKENLEFFVAGKGMERKVKIRIMITVTVLLSVGFIMMDAVPLGRTVLFIIWICHLFYFMFGVKTIHRE